MRTPRKAIATGLSVPERMLLFCVASGTNWQKASVTAETVPVTVVKGLVQGDTAGRLSLTAEGRAALRALLKPR
jgi:hypothetical protein